MYMYMYICIWHEGEHTYMYVHVHVHGIIVLHESSRVQYSTLRSKNFEQTKRNNPTMYIHVRIILYSEKLSREETFAFPYNCTKQNFRAKNFTGCSSPIIM